MAGCALPTDASGERADEFSRLMLVAAIAAAAGAILVALYTLLSGCEDRPTDGLFRAFMVVTPVVGAVALLGSPFAWLARRRSGQSTTTARLAVAVSVLDAVGLLGVGVLVLRVTLQCAFTGPGSSI